MLFYISNRSIFRIVGPLIILFASIVLTNSITFEDDYSLTNNERLTLEKFSENMKPQLDEEYMQQDIYLIRWLRAAKFNLDNAERMLLNNLRWRKVNKIDNLDNEDWSYFEEEFAYSLDILDFKNRPTLTIDSAKWDVRRAVMSGQREKLIRWMIKMMENATKKVRSLEESGKNVTRWRMIYNLGYFNLVQSGCFQCLPVYSEFVNNYEKYYPYTVNKITMVNTPMLFEIVLRLIRPLFSAETKNSLAVFGTNKKQWQEVLLKEIPKNQLPMEYGGSKVREKMD